MNPSTIKKWSTPLLCALLAVSFTACAPRKEAPHGSKVFVEEGDPSAKQNWSVQERRAYQMKRATPERFNKHSILYKVIESRAAVLYLTDILPEKGNPYFHMAEFCEKSLLEAFKIGVKNAPDLKVKGLWLPKNNGKDITAKMLKNDKELAELVGYFAQYVATATVLEKTVYPALASSPVILPLADSTSPEIAKEFARIFGNPKTGQMGHIQFIYKEYAKIFAANPVLAQVLEVARKKVALTIAAIIAEAMEEHLDHVADKADKDQLIAFLAKVKKLATLSTDKKTLDTTKNLVEQAFDTSSPEMKAAQLAFNGVELPDSGSIDGSMDSFEVVMRLDVGFDVLLQVKNETAQW